MQPAAAQECRRPSHGGETPNYTASITNPASRPPGRSNTLASEHGPAETAGTTHHSLFSASPIIPNPWSWAPSDAAAGACSTPVDVLSGLDDDDPIQIAVKSLPDDLIAEISRSASAGGILPRLAINGSPSPLPASSGSALGSVDLNQASSQHGVGLGGLTTPPMTLTPTNPAMEDICSHASEEQQFEYILSCAQRVGFDSFDTMATRYYARNFDPSSTLALEQRRSRNRRLPDLLAELRKCSIHWSTWQRRGYQDETLKAAEEICAIEYNEYRKRQETGVGGADVDEKELEESVCFPVPSDYNTSYLDPVFAPIFCFMGR